MPQPQPASIAVLITYHNEGPLLRRCLESLAAQTLPIGEVLIYDDASTLPPAPFIPGALPVRVLRGETNIGPARARNILMRAAATPVVHFHDADDAFAPEWHRTVASAMQGDVDAVFTEIRSEDEAGVTHERVLDLARLAAGEPLPRFCISGSMLVPAGTYRRERLERLGGYRESLWQSEDWDFHIRFACSQPVVVAIDDALVTIHLRAASRSRDVVDVWTSAVHAVRLLASELPPSHRADLADAAAKAGSRLFRAGALVEARDAFDLARDLGGASYPDQPRLYRALARRAGPEYAERAGWAYRAWVPERLRSLLTQLR